jgi:two-component system, NarL family, nitrate/nitrite response regulator NarL
VTAPPAARGLRIRIALIDDHTIVREGLKHLLETEPNLEVVAEGTDGADALRVVRETHPDVLLLDFAMPRLDGVQALVDLPRGGTRVILLTAAIDADDLLRAVQLGARGVVLKESATRFLIEGIHRVMEGKYVIGSDVVGDFAAAVSLLTTAARRPFGLTPRELEVAMAVADGENNRQIAQRLSLSLQTVKHHLSHIFDKTGVSTRLELALFAIHKGLTKRAASQRRAVASEADDEAQ